MAGFRPSQVVIGIAGELVKGFDDPQPGTQAPRPADHRVRAPEAHRRRPARGPDRGGAGDHLGDRTAACRRSRLVHAAVTVGVDRWLRPDEPGGLPGPPRQDRHLQRLRAAGPPRRAAERRVSSTSSCSRSSPSRTPSRACSAPSRSARPGRCSSTSVAARRTSRSSARAASRARGMFARRPGLHEVDRRPPRPAVPARRDRKVDYARGLDVEAPAGHRGDHRRGCPRVGGRCRAGHGGTVGRRPAAGRIFLCGGGSRLPEIREALAAEPFWKRCRSPPARGDRPVARPDRDGRRRDRPAGRPAGRHPARAAYQAIELQTTADPLDVALKRVLRAMKV